MNEEAARARPGGPPLLEQYEQLRKVALGAFPTAREGFAILVREGMAAWMQGCTFILSQAAQPQPPRSTLGRIDILDAALVDLGGSSGSPSLLTRFNDASWIRP